MPIIAVLIIYVGLLAFLYPTVAGWFSQVNQSRLIESYSETVTGDLDPSAAEQLALAHAYNDALSTGAVLEENERLPTGQGVSSDDTLDYWSILRATPLEVMARLRIPAIDVDLPIYHGTSDATLALGVGHLQGTSLPVGGPGTRAVLTAHRGLASAVLFTHLNQVEVGDTFTIEVLGEVLSYRVRDTQVIDPEDTERLRAEPGKDLVTLVTCTPLGINSQRILVTGERILPTPAADEAAAGEVPDVAGFPWWAVWLIGALVAGVGYIVYAGLPRRRSADED